MIIIIVRTFILYFTVLFSLRVMGKGELSKMDPFQMVVLFMISELASLPISSPNLSLVHGAAAIITLLFLQILISVISLKSNKLRRIFSGQPSVLIEKGTINEKELQRLRISIDDLTQQLRLKNLPSISDLDYAIMEVNGDLSVIPTSQKRPLTPKDMSLRMEEEFLPVVLISDGVLYQKNLKYAGFSEEVLKGKLLSLKITDYKQVFLAFTDENRKLIVYPNQDTNTLKRPKGGDQ